MHYICIYLVHNGLEFCQNFLYVYLCVVYSRDFAEISVPRGFTIGVASDLHSHPTRPTTAAAAHFYPLAFPLYLNIPLTLSLPLLHYDI